MVWRAAAGDGSAETAGIAEDADDAESCGATGALNPDPAVRSTERMLASGITKARRRAATHRRADGWPARCA